MLRRVSREIHERPSNQALGLVPGLANGLITAAIISALPMPIPLSVSINETTRDSAVANRLGGYAQSLEARLRPVFGEAIARSLNLLTFEPDSDERVTLPFTVSSTRPSADLETHMLALVNEARAENALSPLTPDPELTEVVRGHWADLFARGYF